MSFKIDTENGIFSSAKLLVENCLKSDPSLRENKKKIIEKISDCVAVSANLCNFNLADDSAQRIIDEILEDIYIYTEDSSIVKGKEPFKEWYSDARSKKEFFYWKNYSDYLSRQSGWNKEPGGNIVTLDLDTDKTLGLCSDPKNYSSKARYGLVIGNVQSGKTANYIGLICKAADVGYNVIIVITGMLEDLRVQTQKRIEEAFIGWNKSANLSVGVKHRPNKRPKVYTTQEDDYIKATKKYSQDDLTYYQEGEPPLVFVIKKEKNVLNALNNWLERQRIDKKSKLNHSLLLIDDEADNASIDVSNRKDEEVSPSSINAKIRLLTDKFACATYVGYTATPFANIFISPLENEKENLFGRDLFPRDFIQYIKAPSSYTGATRLFVNNEFPNFVKHIPDDEVYGDHGLLPEKHKIHHKLEDLPDSMINAINSFILSTAICWHKGEINKHSSMLINASRFSEIHEDIKTLCEKYIYNIKLQIEFAQDPFSPKDCTLDIERLLTTFETQYKAINDQSFLDISDYVLKVIKKIEVICVNMNNKRQLTYDTQKYPNGRTLIAIGGMSLSRGLTLERLLVSYYSRTSKDYDTMLQMCRWFGYRASYQEQCRLFISEKNHAAYNFLAKTFDELCQEVTTLNKHGYTPMHFALAVREHPARELMVTAARKRGAAKKCSKTIIYSGKLKQNLAVPLNTKYIESNNTLYQSFIQSTDSSLYEQIESRHFSAKGIGLDHVCDFIKNYKYAKHVLSIQKSHLLHYIKEREDELKDWYVIIEARKNSQKSIFSLDETWLVSRTWEQEGNSLVPSYKDSKSVLGPGVILSSLPKNVQEDLKESANGGRITTIDIVNKFKKPILIIIPFRNANIDDQLLVTYSILMPNSKISEPYKDVLVNADVDSYLDDEDEDGGDD